MNSQTFIEWLEAMVQDRTLLGQVPIEQRKRLLIAAGQLSRPDKLDSVKINKARRRAKKRKLIEADKSARASTVIRTTRQHDVFIAPAQIAIPESPADRLLQKPRGCYACKKDFIQLHFFYDAMCKPCGDFNYAKRFQTAPLHGKVAVVTGSRLKIGYHASLMLLRAGAQVIATTRFPHDAARRFSREPDFKSWQTSLQIFGLDLRHSPSVEHFADYINSQYDSLDLLINNAAQTVRRPPGFYGHLMENENKPLELLPIESQALLTQHERCRFLLSSDGASPVAREHHAWLAKLATSGGAIGLQIPAVLSQLPVLPEDSQLGTEVFPEGKTDADLQQVDLREMNSWRMKLADVPTPELLEVQLVNSIAPFILCRKLKASMLRNPGPMKHIVNVSAMEGNFSRKTKTDKHPHTNMAKAALNMMTLTSARDYAEDGIYMNAVDTGWVTDEDPVTFSLRKQAEHDFQPPLDIVDGAARICDPFFSGILTGEPVWGKFLKDYLPTNW
jgi:NAD(P)-dependent dehydrogenase (short-subunit alcohol dehydrogenase family)